MADLKPPFTEETARKKVKAAQALWNLKDPVRVAQAYTPTCIWRNRDSFFSGTEAIIIFLTRKWKREHNYRLRKELFAFTDDRIAVQFWYEYQDAEDGMRWKRCYGLEDWTFDRETGKMRKRMMSGNDLVLGPDGNGDGRWFVDGFDVDAVDIGEEHWANSMADDMGYDLPCYPPYLASSAQTSVGKLQSTRAGFQQDRLYL